MRFNLKIIKKISFFFILTLYTYSFCDKVFNFDQFTLNMLTSPIIPTNYIGVLRYLILIIEILGIFLILFFKKSDISYYYVFFVSILFLSYFVLFKILGGNSKCGCGKLFESMGFLSHLLLVNIPLVIFSLILLFNNKKI